MSLAFRWTVNDHLAEEASKWARAAKHYDNLLELEADLAYLSALILVFVESAGSIAELGAFCQARVLSKKLVAVLEHGHQDEQSFIQDGPVALLQRNDQDSVHFYPWLGAPDKYGKKRIDRHRAEETVRQLLDWLLRRMKGLKKKERFRKSHRGHRLLLIADLIELGTIVQLGEIVSLLIGLGVKIETNRLKRYLFLLEKLNLIDKTKYGHKTYYVAGTDSAVYVDYALKLRDKAWDRLRAKSDLHQTLLRMDPDRKNARELHEKKSRK